MSSQRHDTRHKKRKAAPMQRHTPINSEWLARELVRRGLASPAILDIWHKPARRTEQL